MDYIKGIYEGAVAFFKANPFIAGIAIGLLVGVVVF